MDAFWETYGGSDTGYLDSELSVGVGGAEAIMCGVVKNPRTDIGRTERIIRGLALIAVCTILLAAIMVVSVKKNKRNKSMRYYLGRLVRLVFVVILVILGYQR